ncbi:MAG: Smr/MutS family protein, partial [Candidatus Eisenbacteria bacterium]|nr:Smr/MutS family protein [Candidatus Eisenbacteria bacterium]
MNPHTLTVLEFEKVRRMLLRWTFSSLGRERIEALHPSLPADEVRLSLDRISEWKALELTGEAPSPDPIEDLSPLFRRLTRSEGALAGADLVLFLPLLQQLGRLRRLLRAEDAERRPLLREMLAPLEDFSELTRRLERSLSGTGEVRSEASPALARARQALVDAQQDVSGLLDGMLNRLPASSREDAFVTVRDGRYVVSVRAQHRESFPGLLHGRSQTGHSVLIEPLDALEANNRVADRREEARLVEVRVLAELTQALRDRGSALERAYEAVGACDAVRAGAKLALTLRAEAPELTERTLRVVQGRHPLLADAEMRGGARVVPLDLVIEADRPVLLVSGPNMGGKTVALKTVGLLVLMARAGLHVPAAPGTELPLVDEVFVDLGDEQSIEDDLSTFAGHLKNVGAMWDRATRDSLVLMDELGGATDPEEGAALATALLDEMGRRGALTVATTHLTSLKLFVQERAEMQNAAMEFDAVSLEPRYRLEIGEPGRSRAFDIARRVLPGSGLLERAQEFRSSQLVEMDRIFERVDVERRALEQARRALDEERRVLSGAVDRKDRQAARLKDRIEALRRAREDAIESALARAQHEIRELRERLEQELTTQRGEDAVRTARRAERDLQAARGNAHARGARRQRLGTSRLQPEQVKEGVEAWIADLGAVVRVERVRPDSNKVRVEWRGRHLEVALGALETVPADRARTSPTPVRVQLPDAPTEPVSPEIDLRGHRVEEAMESLERYLDRATMSGRTLVRIIHGKGTGTLKKEV